MATILQSYQIAVGKNNPGGLTFVNQITDANGVRLVMPRGLPYRTRGERRFDTDGGVSRIGFDGVQWRFQGMTLAQYALLIGTYEGPVTIHHPLTSTIFANFNAELWMPDESELEYGILNGSTYDSGLTGPGYRGGIFANFIKVEAI